MPVLYQPRFVISGHNIFTQQTPAKQAFFIFNPLDYTGQIAYNIVVGA